MGAGGEGRGGGKAEERRNKEEEAFSDFCIHKHNVICTLTSAN